MAGINLTGAWERQAWVSLESRTGLPGPPVQPILSSDPHDIPGNACPASVYSQWHSHGAFSSVLTEQLLGAKPWETCWGCRGNKT